jgi:hypothetical protein
VQPDEHEHHDDHGHAHRNGDAHRATPPEMLRKPDPQALDREDEARPSSRSLFRFVEMKIRKGGLEYAFSKLAGQEPR